MKRLMMLALSLLSLSAFAVNGPYLSEVKSGSYESKSFLSSCGLKLTTVPNGDMVAHFTKSELNFEGRSYKNAMRLSVSSNGQVWYSFKVTDLVHGTVFFDNEYDLNPTAYVLTNGRQEIYSCKKLKGL